MAFWSRHDKLEDRLRAERPRPSDDLISSIKGDLADAKPSLRRRSRPQFRLAGLTAALALGVLAVGGAGYAMTSGADFATMVVHHTFFAPKTAVHTVANDSACDVYNTCGGGGGGGSPTPPPPTTTPTPPVPLVSVPGLPASGTLFTGAPTTVTAYPTSGTPAEVVFPAFPSEVVATVDSDPPATAASRFQGPSAQSIVSINLTDPTTGKPIHQLPAPMEIVFSDAPAGYVPGLSENGSDFTPLRLIPGGATSLPDGWHDGYYVVGTAVHILTDHLTSFAVLYKANFAQSESGRKTAAAGSGKFGDPTRIHAGAPKVDVPGTPTASGSHVNFSFFVDEQAAVYVHVLSGSNDLVLGNSSTIRSHKIGGKSRKTFHLVILRPGLIKMNLHVPGVKAGAKVQLTFVDFDGNKVSKTVTVK